MGLFTKDIATMDDLFLHTLQDIYYAEKQIVKSLPKMIEKASKRELASGLRAHLKETEQQVKRLEQVFAKLGHNAKAVNCPAIDGIIEEADEISGEIADKKVLDAAVIGSAQAVEHYEITRYGTLIAWAKELGHKNVVPLLNANLKEEKAADKKLTALATTKAKVNARAAGKKTTSTRSASSGSTRTSSSGSKSPAKRATSSSSRTSSTRGKSKAA